MKSALALAPFLALLFSLTASRPAIAISEKGYQQAFAEQVLPYYEKNGVPGSFEGVGGTRIAYRVFENPQETGALVIVSGRTEFMRKFAEVIYDIARSSRLSLYILDHRGQGESGRMLPDPQIGYVEDFDDYVTDLDTFIRTVVDARPHAKRYVLTNSMGGPIASLYMAAHPEEFDAAVLSSPMFEINTSPYPEPIAYGIVATACFLGLGKHYALGQNPYDFGARPSESSTTESSARFEMAAGLVAAEPSLALGGASNRWIKTSMEAATRARKLAPQVVAPTLVFQAGADTVVRPGGQDDFCSRAPHCAEQAFPGSRHEILMERDSIREGALSTLLSFLASH